MSLSRRVGANQASVSGGHLIEYLSCRLFIGCPPRFESYWYSFQFLLVASWYYYRFLIRCPTYPLF